MNRAEVDLPRFTLTIMLLCMVFYLASLMLGFEQMLSKLHFPIYSQPDTFVQFWRFLSPVFLHFSHLHIGFNLVAWWVLASATERYWGSKTLVTIFLWLALVSNVCQYLAADERFGGLSGVVYGMFGFLWAYSKLSPKAGFSISKVVVWQIVFHSHS